MRKNYIHIMMVKIYWTTANGNQNKIIINVLDISESISHVPEQIRKR